MDKEVRMACTDKGKKPFLTRFLRAAAEDIELPEIKSCNTDTQSEIIIERKNERDEDHEEQ